MFMKTCFSLLLLALGGFGSLVPLHAQTAFTYQGRLTSGGNPASGSHDFRFILFGVASNGNPIAGPLTNPAVLVSNGLFTVALDFGANAFTGADRWLEIAARPAGGGTFSTLAPRQPITPTPMALVAQTALNIPGVSGSALHAADGNPQNAVFVNNAGKVGVGTTTPLTALHLSGTNSRLRLESTRNDNWTITEYRTDGREWHTGIGGSQVPFDLGGRYYIFDATAGQFRLLVDTVGNVHVPGDIRMGPTGAVRATGGDESLRIVRGRVSKEGTILAGTGFQVTSSSRGAHRIRFTTPFAAPPVVTCALGSRSTLEGLAMVPEVAADSVEIWAYTIGQFGGFEDFHFIAIGPR